MESGKQGQGHPSLTHILVATGVARSERHIDPARLTALIEQVRVTAQA